MKKTSFSKGDIVVVVSPFNRSFPYPIVGGSEEEEGEVIECLPNNHYQISFKEFYFFKEQECIVHFDNLLLLEDYKQTQQYLQNQEDNKRIFEKGDIVYLFTTNNRYHAEPGWPMVGSEYETDMKVLSANISKFKSKCVYSCHIPEYGPMNFNGKLLISPEERFKLKYKTSKGYTLNHDIKGVAKKGDSFVSLGEYMFDTKTHTISIFITSEMLKSFTEI